jgi:hypothetical protein
VQLCGDCVTHIADRRAAHFVARQRDRAVNVHRRTTAQASANELLTPNSYEPFTASTVTQKLIGFS